MENCQPNATDQREQLDAAYRCNSRSPARESVSSTECVIVAGGSGIFEALFRHHRSHTLIDFAFDLVVAGGLVGAGG